MKLTSGKSFGNFEIFQPWKGKGHKKLEFPLWSNKECKKSS